MINHGNDACGEGIIIPVPCDEHNYYLHANFTSMKRLFLVIPVLLLACSPGKKPATTENQYKAELMEWVTKREAALKAPNGWLNLVGLHWLEEGDNTFGSDAGNKIVFPQGKIAGHAGVFRREGKSVTLLPAAGVDIRDTRTGQPFAGGMIFHPDSTRSEELTAGDLRWTIIRRGELLGIRLRDDHAQALAEFHGVPRFPAALKWRTEAVRVPDQSAHGNGTLTILNVLGQETAEKSGGVFRFRLGSKIYELEAIDDGGKELFIVFGDQTNGEATYGGGRFLYIRRPDADGKTIIDFNKAINPPCVFTAFATCPLPPRQNRLQLKIEAGEKVEAGH